MIFALVFNYDGFLLGFKYFPKITEEDYSELNIYLLFIILHFKFYKNE
jgi:hypothetical protein